MFGLLDISIDVRADFAGQTGEPVDVWHSLVRNRPHVSAQCDSRLSNMESRRYTMGMHQDTDM